jgi:hypothetical protein
MRSLLQDDNGVCLEVYFNGWSHSSSGFVCTTFMFNNAPLSTLFHPSKSVGKNAYQKLIRYTNNIDGTILLIL